jgi:hypothetical protein
VRKRPATFDAAIRNCAGRRLCPAEGSTCMYRVDVLPQPWQRPLEYTQVLFCRKTGTAMKNVRQRSQEFFFSKMEGGHLLNAHWFV